MSDPKLYAFFNANETPLLEIALASPLMTMFANVVPLSVSTQVLTMFMLDGEAYMTELFLNLLTNMSDEIYKRAHDPFELSSYLSRAIYLDALRRD